jgi:hypothetical protein
MVCPLRFVLVAASALIAVVALFHFTEPEQTAADQQDKSTVSSKVTFYVAATSNLSYWW